MNLSKPSKMMKVKRELKHVKIDKTPQTKLKTKFDLKSEPERVER